MKALIATAATILMLASANLEANEPTVAVIRAGSQPSSRAPEQYFTGSVRRDPLFPVSPPSRMVGGSVTFEAGARSA
jgi:quercetin dioxygenase-like cupin family protein